MTNDTKESFWTSIPGILTGLATLVTALGGLYVTLNPSEISETEEPCLIKGNVSQNSGERIYHVPGDKDYNETIIDESNGEKWFCTEKEALVEGWQRAPQ
jgi:hypothetical protein